METVPVVVATVAPGPGEPSVLRFDGSDDRVTVPYSPTFPTEVFSFGAWIKLAPPRGRAAIFARGEDDNSFNLPGPLRGPALATRQRGPLAEFAPAETSIP